MKRTQRIHNKLPLKLSFNISILINFIQNILKLRDFFIMFLITMATS